MNLDTQSSDSSAEVMRESGRSFQSLMVLGKEAFLIDIFTRYEIPTCQMQHGAADKKTFE